MYKIFLMMTGEERTLLRNIAFICFASTLKGTFIFKNFTSNEESLTLINILKELGVNITLENGTLRMHSHGAFHLFEPKKQIDVKGSKAVLFALCGLFAPYDYTVFFEDSTERLSEEQFHSIILGFYDVGIHFSYSKDFTLPFNIKGSSNFLPIKHEILKQNPFLEMAFLILGLQGFAKTSIYFKDVYGFIEILHELKANCKKIEGGVAVALQPQNVNQILEIDVKNYE